MKYCSSLLKKYISVDVSADDIAQHLILKTVEIEWIEHREISEKIVIWYVTECTKHPDADKLNVCQVNCGDKWQYQIICGGVNVRAGIFVPVALPGTVFEKAWITIEPRKMRWIESNWMICSKEEIWINEDLDTHNIRELILDLEDISDKDLWTPLKAKFPRLESYILEVDNKWLTNRPDLTGHFGIACELNSIYRDAGKFTYNKVKDYFHQFDTTNILEILEHWNKAKRNVVCETEWLNSYTLLELNNVNVKESSFFTRLQMIDMWSNPRSNRVDFSNLFMLLTGQPIHFFDAEKVNWDVIIRNAKDWEEFVDLFETKHVLKSNDMVIADKDKILALAGVVGWLDSWITENTKNILVEIANFDPVLVRKTWTRLALRTDAEIRYEKNINPRWSLYCLILFLDELKYYAKDLWTFEIWWTSSFVKESIIWTRNKQINIDYKKMEMFTFWKEVEWFSENAKKILISLWFGVNENIVNVPIWRWPGDINIVEDLYEEVGRINGYENIEDMPLLSDAKYVDYPDYVGLNRKIEEILVRNLNFDQTETYSRVWEKQINQFWINKEDLYSLQNPTNPEMPFMRDDILPWLVLHTAKNSKFFDNFRIFDTWKIRRQSRWKDLKDAKFADDFVWEKGQVGMMIYHKDISNRNNDPILAAKSYIEIIARELWLKAEIKYVSTEINHFHPKKQADVMYFLRWKEIKIWFVGSLHPLILKDYKMPENAWVVYVSLDMENLIEACKSVSFTSTWYESLQDQIIYRDLCFVVDSDKAYDKLLEAVKWIKEISDIELFDLYQWANLGEWKKSIAVKIKISWDWSLTTEWINEIMNKAIKAGEKAWWKLRW